METEVDFVKVFVLSLILAILSVIAFKNLSMIIYYYKFLSFAIYVSLVAIIFLPFFALRPRDAKNFIVLSKYMRFLTKLGGLNIKFENAEKLKSFKGAVIVANHQSSIDSFVVYEASALLNIKISVVAKKILLYTGPYGLTSWLAGTIVINRSKSKDAIQTINEAFKNAKENDIKVWTFPEGTRHDTGRIHEFKKGVFMAAINAQLPIVPLVQNCYLSFLNSKQKRFNSGEIKVSVMDEIPTHGLTAADVDELIAKTHQMMSLEFDRISQL